MLRIAMAHEDPSKRAALLSILLKTEIPVAELYKIDEVYDEKPDQPNLGRSFLGALTKPRGPVQPMPKGATLRSPVMSSPHSNA
jgi:hypothetical protein